MGSSCSQGVEVRRVKVRRVEEAKLTITMKAISEIQRKHADIKTNESYDKNIMVTKKSLYKHDEKDTTKQRISCVDSH